MPSPCARSTRRAAIAAGAAALLATLSGCMTAMSQVAFVAYEEPGVVLDPRAVLYGGTRAHGRLLDGAFTHGVLPEDLLLLLFEVVDLPLSVVGDTVLLPITLIEHAAMRDPR